MKINVFSARCITNLHVGNGDVNYNIIDQEVEKDPINGLPMINASGVKGAVREFFENKWGKSDSRVKNIFGTGEDITAQGSYKFLQADIIFRPLRVTSEGNRSYVLTTTEEIINGFAEKVKGLNGNIEGISSFKNSNEKVRIEGGEIEIPLKKADGKWADIVNADIAVIDSISKYDLPVIARNVLDDKGISKNLWYEEFVPHESIFSLIILTPTDMDGDFKTALTSEPVQFGANASIGYGLMDIREVRL